MEPDNTTNKTPLYIRVGDKKIIYEQAITWVRKMDECLYICSSTSGCLNGDHVICKHKYPDVYNNLNDKWFK